MVHGAREIEIKLAVPDAPTARSKLRSVGFAVVRRRVFETNVVFDTPGLALRRTARLLRLRQAGRIATLTYKGQPEVARHKSREEVESEVSDRDALGTVLERLGFLPVFRYDKYRTEYRQGGRGGVAMLDETPIGVFIELEGTPAWIDRSARRLGFSEADYITSSYGRLYLEWCRRQHRKAADMVF